MEIQLRIPPESHQDIGPAYSQPIQSSREKTHGHNQFCHLGSTSRCKRGQLSREPMRLANPPPGISGTVECGRPPHRQQTLPMEISSVLRFSVSPRMLGSSSHVFSSLPLILSHPRTGRPQNSRYINDIRFTRKRGGIVHTRRPDSRWYLMFGLCYTLLDATKQNPDGP